MAQQIVKKFISNDAVDASKIKLLASEALRGTNASNAEVELIKINGTDKLIVYRTGGAEEVGYKSQIDQVASDLANEITARVNADAEFLKLDGTRPMAEDLSMANHRISLLTDPALAQDAANKRYVDADGGQASNNLDGSTYNVGTLKVAMIDISSGSAASTKFVLPALSSVEVGQTYTFVNATSVTLQTGGGIFNNAADSSGSSLTPVPAGHKGFVTKTSSGSWAFHFIPIRLASAYLFGNRLLSGVSTPVAGTDAANKTYVDGKVADTITDGVTTIAPSQNAVFDALASKEDKNGTANFIRVDGTNSMGADLNLAGNKIMNVVDPTDAQHAATKNYVDTQDALKVSKAGDSMSGNLAMGGNSVTGLASPTNGTDAANKNYVDASIAGLDFQKDVEAVQVDNTLVPALTTGARYIITNAASMHANFGSISGLSNNDIVEYNGSAFVVAYDVSVQGEGALVWNRTTNVFLKYDGSIWDEFGGLAGVTAGIGLSKTGNQLDINLGAGIAQLPSDEVGVDVHASGALILTEDGTTESSASAAQLAVKLDGSTLSKSTSGLKVADAGITDTQIASAAAIDLTKLAALAPGYAVRSNDSTGFLEISGVTNTELGYVSGVTSSIQDQLDAKADSSALADYVKNDGSVAMIESLDLGSNQIINLADPTALQQAATKNYVDNAIANVSQTYNKMIITLSAGDITNGYVDLDHEIVANSLVACIGRLAIHETEDYTLSVVSGKTRVTFGSLIGAGVEAPEAGDKMFFTYAY